ncbi:replication initiation factor domain-containing protein [Undibacterium amnicola]|uniref:Replication initiation factor domain-containing protein n=1 Tax=Undibacterium amnicola TaxID=1834038 RepID=A0ABR6XVV8_9BURK|nr:replication initiation factor domain-containing protein [Undibacterium amnicola]MBC3833599.1 replication initiation factor domain-containing protein [Undibacterium amnicola]
MIDRIHLNVKIPSNELYSFALGQLEGIRELKHRLVPKGNISISKGKYLTRLNYYPTKKNLAANIIVATTKKKHRYFQLCLYPSKFKIGEFKKFSESLAMFFDIFTYENLFTNSRISYVEFAIDSLTHTAHDFIPYRRRCNMSEIFVEHDGTMGSTYLGSTKSDTRFCIYDKKKQLEKSSPVPEKTRTRIEARLRNVSMPPCELISKMKNPFLTLQIADLKKAKQLTEEIEWQSFLLRCLETGSAKALSELKKAQRKAFNSRLDSVRASWWNPNYVWKYFENALLRIAPCKD